MFIYYLRLMSNLLVCPPYIQVKYLIKVETLSYWDFLWSWRNFDMNYHFNERLFVHIKPGLVVFFFFGENQRWLLWRWCNFRQNFLNRLFTWSTSYYFIILSVEDTNLIKLSLHIIKLTDNACVLRKYS